MNFCRILASPHTKAILTVVAILSPSLIGFGQATNPKQAPGVADLVARVARGGVDHGNQTLLGT
jgi:hypothetical protein